MTVLTGLLVGIAAFLAAPRVAHLEPRGPVGWAMHGSLRFLTPAVVGVALVRLEISPLLVVVAVGGAAAGQRALRRRGARQQAERRREQVLVACEGLAADLAAGLAPVRALQSMATEWPELRPIAQTAEVGGDVAAAFRAVAAHPGAEALGVAAAAWSVSSRSGAGLAGTIAFAADSMRADRATARVIAAELAAALATARLLTLLPVGVLLIGRGMGGDPVAFLLGSLAGQVCLAVGLALVWSGSLWLERIADQIGRP